MVDNCYGEFVSAEPTDLSDVIAGSLIKNPGGGLALLVDISSRKKRLPDRISYRSSRVQALGQNAD